MWLGIIVFPVSLCMIMSTSTFVSTIFYNYKKQTFGRDLLVRPKKIFCSGETLHVLVDIVRSVSFSIFNEKKKWEKSIGFFFCSKQTDVVSLSVLSQLKGVLYAKFWNLEDTCLCVCVFVTNLVLFRWVETSNNRICWSCIFIFQASYCLMKVNFPVLCGYLFSRFLYKNKK